jgi:hypothetical protein
VPVSQILQKAAINHPGKTKKNAIGNNSAHKTSKFLRKTAIRPSPNQEKALSIEESPRDKFDNL